MRPLTKGGISSALARGRERRKSPRCCVRGLQIPQTLRQDPTGAARAADSAGPGRAEPRGPAAGHVQHLVEDVVRESDGLEGLVGLRERRVALKLQCVLRSVLCCSQAVVLGRRLDNTELPDAIVAGSRHRRSRGVPVGVAVGVAAAAAAAATAACV